MTTEQENLENSALKLEWARWLTKRIRLRYSTVDDITGLRAVHRIFYDVETERRRWLDALDNL
ncbi:MAG: hypothetical protein ACRDTG_02060 [Pseudonocardiaceae bacterium]